MQIATNRINMLLRWCEYAYVVVLLFALTQGPVLSMWFASSLQWPSGVLSAQVLTFIALQLPALLLLGYRRVPRASIIGPVGLLGLFCGWMWLSTLWATLGQHTVVEATTLCLTFLTGVYFARSFSLLEQLILVVVAMQPGLLWSRFAIANGWSNSVDLSGDWTGIYFNRNSLAPVAMVSCLAASALLWIVIMRRGRKLPITLMAILVDVILFGAVTLFHTKSNTSVGGALVFIAVWMFWTIIRSMTRRSIITVDFVRRRLYPLFVGLVLFLTWCAIQFQSLVLGIFGENYNFNGRLWMWRFSWTGFLDRPWLGWGWMSAWRTEAFLTRDKWWAFAASNWSHSSYMDILLGGGILAAILFVSAIIWSGYRNLNLVRTTTAGQWNFAILFFILSVSTQESFFIGNHFLWLLLVAAISGPIIHER
jgi:O-antigen ligase